MSWESATAPQSVKQVILVELLLDTPVRVHNGVGWKAWNEHNWGGVGQLGGISAITGGVDLNASDIQLILSGVLTTAREEILSEVARGARCNIYQGIADEVSGLWSFEPELIFSGFNDAPEIEEKLTEGGEAFLTITLPVLGAASYARRLQIWRRTDADQKSLYPGDKFFEFKTDLNVPIAAPIGGGPVLPGDFNHVGGTEIRHQN